MLIERLGYISMGILYRFAAVQRSSVDSNHCVASLHDLMLAEARLDVANYL